MKAWALFNSVLYYAHVFYPLINAMAEKHDSFVVYQIAAYAMPGTLHAMARQQLDLMDLAGHISSQVMMVCPLPNNIASISIKPGV
jgi:hypothetical protein